MDTAKLFIHGRSQAVRLPKAYRFEGDEVCVARLDDMVILYPIGRGWDVLERGLEHFGEDYMAQRNQPEAPEERRGL